MCYALMIAGSALIIGSFFFGVVAGMGFAPYGPQIVTASLIVGAGLMRLSDNY
jgi:hypothetical protein